MLEILESSRPLLLVLLGSFTSILGGIFQFRISEKSRRNTLLSSKLERAYGLCQLIVDRHKQEIGNTRTFLPHDTDKYLEKRCCPTTEMNELKMLVRTHIPDLKNLLETIDSGHNHLKISFDKIDKAIANGTIDYKMPHKLTQIDIDNWDDYLAKVNEGSSKLKNALEEKMSSLV